MQSWLSICSISRCWMRVQFHSIHARRVAGVVDIDLFAAVNSSPEFRGCVRPDRSSPGIISRSPESVVDPYAVAHFATQQLVNRDPERFARDIPKRGFNAGQRGDIYAGLRAREDARCANAFKGRFDIEADPVP